MRLIGTFEQEKEAYAFYAFLLKEGIQNIYEPYTEEKTHQKLYRIWVYDEDDLDLAIEWMNRYKQNPNDPHFQTVIHSLPGTPSSPGYAEISEKEEEKWQSVPTARSKTYRFRFPLTQMIILLCIFLFLWNDYQEAQLYQEKGPVVPLISFTPLQQELLFDLPSSYRYIQEAVDTTSLQQVKEIKELPPDTQALLQKAETAPAWRGVYDYFLLGKKEGWKSANATPMFEKIKEGEVWRLFTPCLLHAGFLHILFNMIWVFILSRQIEARVNRWKICLFILVVAIVSNVAQYLMSGPDFVGFSGVICGMAGFIWMRQRLAPWEGYPLDRGTLLFLLFFVIAMFVLELITFSLQVFSVIQITPIIANTAHIVGGLTGIFLGRMRFFSRRMA